MELENLENADSENAVSLTALLSTCIDAASRGCAEIRAVHEKRSSDGALRAWAATMAPTGRFAAAFFNLGSQPCSSASISVMAVLNASATGPLALSACKISDMWSGAALGSVGVTAGAQLTVTSLPAHGSRLLQLNCA